MMNSQKNAMECAVSMASESEFLKAMDAKKQGNEPLASEELAELIDGLGVRGESHIQFIIGGSLGLSKNVLSRADYKLSFSKMTFPHQLMRVILLEQIYRSYRIINGEPYHK